jgi:glycosyltransferase involved in cell wall biosynthesis
MKKGNPLVSVIMSVYNGERFLRESIDSILNQTYKNFEFIIINDGSTDRTSEILNSYYDERIKVINQSNQGLTKSLNKGIKLSKGTFLARQDADDISLPERLKEQVEFLESHPEIALVGTFAMFIDILGKDVKMCREVPTDSDTIKRDLLESNCFYHGSVMLRKSIIDADLIYDESLQFYQDYDLWLRISEKFNVSNIPKILYKVRRHPKGVSRNLEPLMIKLREKAAIRLVSKRARLQIRYLLKNVNFKIGGKFKTTGSFKTLIFFVSEKDPRINIEKRTCKLDQLFRSLGSKTEMVKLNFPYGNINVSMQSIKSIIGQIINSNPDVISTIGFVDIIGEISNEMKIPYLSFIDDRIPLLINHDRIFTDLHFITHNAKDYKTLKDQKVGQVHLIKGKTQTRQLLKLLRKEFEKR